MSWVDFALGFISGIIVFLTTSILVSVRLIRNPPEAILKAIGRNMARQVTRGVKRVG